MKDGDNALSLARQPGSLAALLGGRVDYYYPLDIEVGLSGLGIAGAARVWAETLEVQPGTTVLARYSAHSGWLSNKPAFVVRERGNGWIAYIGALLDDDGQMGVVRWASAKASLSPSIIPAQSDLEVVERRLGRRRYFVAINHGDRDISLALPAKLSFILGDISGSTLAAHGVALFAYNLSIP